jgi:hypothetical protein
MRHGDPIGDSIRDSYDISIGMAVDLVADAARLPHAILF